VVPVLGVVAGAFGDGRPGVAEGRLLVVEPFEVGSSLIEDADDAAAVAEEVALGEESGDGAAGCGGRVAFGFGLGFEVGEAVDELLHLGARPSEGGRVTVEVGHGCSWVWSRAASMRLVGM